MAKEYVAPYNDLVVGKTYRVELWASWPPARMGVIKQSLSKVIKISYKVISFETQKYNKELSKLSTTYDVPRDGRTSRSGYYYKIFETAKDMTDRKLTDGKWRKQALEQALQTGSWNTSSTTGVDGRVIKFNEPVTSTAMVMANGWVGGGRKYKTRKTKMHKKKKMRTKKNTNKKMKKKQTRTRRKR